MQYKVVYKSLTGDAQVLASNAAVPAGFVDAGNFSHPDTDLLESQNSHVVFQHVRDRVLTLGEQNMQRVNIVWPSKVVATAVSIGAASLTLMAGQEQQLTPTYTPAAVSQPGVSYHMLDEHVAQISPQGLVAAVGPGHTILTVTVDDGGAILRIPVTVNPKA